MDKCTTPRSILKRTSRLYHRQVSKKHVRFCQYIEFSDESTPTVECILAEMIERRELLTPIGDDSEEILRTTPRAKLEMLKKRFYTPLKRHSDRGLIRPPFYRLWRLRAGLHDLQFFDQGVAVLRYSSENIKVRLPSTMEWPSSSTKYLKMGQPGKDPRFPKGKAEWV